MQSKKGFTLIELMVATAAASIISLSAFQFYGQFHRMFLHFQKSYLQESISLIEKMSGAMPYGLGKKETSALKPRF